LSRFPPLDLFLLTHAAFLFTTAHAQLFNGRGSLDVWRRHMSQ